MGAPCLYACLIFETCDQILMKFCLRVDNSSCRTALILVLLGQMYKIYMNSRWKFVDFYRSGLSYGKDIQHNCAYM
jgi:hypothetical protein